MLKGLVRWLEGVVHMKCGCGILILRLDIAVEFQNCMLGNTDLVFNVT